MASRSEAQKKWWDSKSPEEKTELRRKYHRNSRDAEKKWKLENKEKISEYKKEFRKRHKGKKEFWAKENFHGIKKRCKEKGIDFDLTEEFLLSLCCEFCPALGVKLDYGAEVNAPSGASVDRTNPKKGYVFGNISVISRRANAIKNDAENPSELRRIADWMEIEINNGDKNVSNSWNGRKSNDGGAGC